MSLLASSAVPSLSTTGLQELLQTWGYGVVFVAMLLESAGLPLPGETITLLGRYAAGTGQLQVLRGPRLLSWWESRQLDSGDAP
jgi:hypothetical protein